MCWSAFIVLPCGCFHDVICVPTSSMGCVVCCYLVFVTTMSRYTRKCPEEKDRLGCNAV
jgi:hypothetical protein